MFSRGAIFLAVLLFTLQDEVFANNSTISPTNSSQSSLITPTWNSSAGMKSTSLFTSSLTPTTVTRTYSTPISETPTTPPSEIPDSPKTCGKMTVTIHTAQGRSKDDVNTTIQGGLFNNPMMYDAVKITNMEIDVKDEQIEVTFNFCLVFKSESGYIEDFAKEQFEMLFNATKIDLRLEESGVDLEWNPAEGECKKCSDGAGGEFKIEQKCNSKNDSYSCNGLKLKSRETKDCVKYCDDSGAVSIVASFFILPVGMAMSLSFYLWE